MQTKEASLVATEKAILVAEQRLQTLQESAANIQEMLDNVAAVEKQALTIVSAHAQDGAHAMFWKSPVNITRTIHPGLEIVIYTHPLGQNIIKFSELSPEGLANVQACIEETAPCLSMTATRFKEGGVDYDWDAQIAIFWYQQNGQPATLVDFRDFDAGAAATLTAKSQELRAKAIAQQ